MQDSPLRSDSSSVATGYPIGRAGRLVLAVCCLSLIGGFGLSVFMTPSPQGFGTHRQLGLPPCSFRDLTGLPCPSCGMTTSFSHFVRGQWLQSIQTSSTAFILALICAGLIPWCVVSISAGHLRKVDRPGPAILILLGSLYLIAATEWIIRILHSL